MKSRNTCLAVIPARYQSTRLPGKPLEMIGEKTLLQRVWEQATQAKEATAVVIATDDPRIESQAQEFGARVVMTGDHLRTGTDRVAETYQMLVEDGEEYNLAVNVQGDMPFINPEVIDRTIVALRDAESSFGMSTVVTPITSKEEFERPHSVKVAIGENGRALYFSRASIPHARDGYEGEEITEEAPYGYKHLGLYVYRPDTLQQLANLPEAFPEKREKLEQLRALSSGIGIKACIIGRDLLEPSIEVDTPEDLEKARAMAS